MTVPEFPGGRPLAVSPHLDDAVLSAGGVIARAADRGDRPVVLTVFAGPPTEPPSAYARRHHRLWNLGDDAVIARRREDLAAQARIGAEAVHGEVPDAIYRRAPDGRWLCGPDTGELEGLPPEPAVEEAVAALLRETIARFDPAVILAPYGLGGHVDHLHVRRAAETVSGERNIPLLRWLDQPYAAHGRLDGALADLHVPYGGRTLEAKLSAIACYRSQFGILWYRGDEWRSLIGATRCHRPHPPGECFLAAPPRGAT
jgi:LmbE family N-acetylglucosaminyl deacetylase